MTSERKKALWVLLALAAVLGAVALAVGPDRIRAFGHWLYDVRGVIAWGGYTALTVIVFAETGLLVGFFLPGNSLLVTAGVLADPTIGLLDIGTLQALLIPAAIAGDAVNYALGRRTGPAIFSREDSLVFKKAHLERTQRFYARHGGKTVILARFLPIVRTFAPYAAGMAGMSYRRFALFNVVGAVLWVAGMTFTGYLLAKTVPDIDRHLHIVVPVVILLSFVPAIVEFARERMRLRRETRAAASDAAEADRVDVES